MDSRLFGPSTISCPMMLSYRLPNKTQGRIGEALCDIIHTMCEDTVELSEAFSSQFQEKIVNIPHPTYENFYPSQYSELESRFQLGVNSDEFVFLFLAQSKHTKDCMIW